MVHPVILGRGKKLFRDKTDMRTLHLVDVTTTTSGLVTLTYRPARAMD